jgi:hypothetical protein
VYLLTYSIPKEKPFERCALKGLIPSTRDGS